MAPAWRNFKNIFFTICTWPNRPVATKILSGFQFEGKSDVWISQVRRVKYLYFLVLQIFVLVFEKFKRSKIHSEMNWNLDIFSQLMLNIFLWQKDIWCISLRICNSQVVGMMRWCFWLLFSEDCEIHWRNSFQK